MVATCRILRRARTAGLLSKMSCSELMEDLSSAWRKVNGPVPPASDDGYWGHTLKIVFEELEALELSKPAVLLSIPGTTKRAHPVRELLCHGQNAPLVCT